MLCHLPVVAVAFLLPSALLGAQDAGNGLAVKPDPDNVVASRLLGRWQLDAEQTRRLGGKGVGETIEFRDDAKVLAGVPKQIAERLRQHAIYLAGTLVLQGKEQPFLLTEVKGNPHVVWFRERNGEPMGDAESFNVMLVRAAANANDLLFVGGDFNNQPFSAYGRPGKDAPILQPTAVIAEMIRLLEAGKHLEMIKTYMAPADLERKTRQGRTPEQMAEEFSQQKAGEVLTELRRIAKEQPTMSEDGTKATWSKGDFGHPLSLVRIGQRWYVSED